MLVAEEAGTLETAVEVVVPWRALKVEREVTTLAWSPSAKAAEAEEG